MMLFTVVVQADDPPPSDGPNFQVAQSADIKGPDEYPGWIAGDWSERPEALFREAWVHRSTTCEILFPSQKEIAHTIYGLALFTKDLDRAVTLERFSKGAMGFHYSIKQIIEWATAVTTEDWEIRTREEEILLTYLISEGILVKKNGGFVAGRGIKHIVGAAAGNKRNLPLNLKHERLHVLWDENLRFKVKWVSKWEALNEDQRAAVFEKLKGYNREDEMLIIEEWAVRQNEARSLRK